MKQFYRASLHRRSGYSSSRLGAYETGAFSGLSSGFSLSSAPSYPAIEDELKKDVAILASSLEIRDNYIDELRKTRDSLITELDMKDTRIESLKKSLDIYKELIRRIKELKKLKKVKFKQSETFGNLENQETFNEISREMSSSLETFSD